MTYDVLFFRDPLTETHEIELALRFTLTQPITAALPPGDEALFRCALDFATRFTPLSPAEQNELELLAASLDPVFCAS